MAFVLFAVGCVLAPAEHAVAAERFAVVAGVEDYAAVIGPAPGALADAAYVSVALEDSGFTVRRLENPEQRDIRGAAFWLAEQLDAAGGDAIGIFYFAGYGAQVDDRTYLLGVDARAHTALAITATGLTADFVVEKMNEGGNRSNIVVIDAGAPMAATQRLGLRPGLESFDRPDGGVVILSDNPGEAAPPRQPGVSDFARAFGDFATTETSDFNGALETFRIRVRDDTDAFHRAWTAGGFRDGLRLRRPDAPPPGELQLSESELSGDGATEEATHPTETRLVTVLFATSRAQDETRAGMAFTAASANTLRFGSADVSTTTTHLNSSRPTYEGLGEPGPESAITADISSVSFQGDEAFFTQIDPQGSAASDSGVLVFVHGFDTSFEDGLERAARLHAALGLDGRTIAYLWPSLGIDSGWGYQRDALSAVSAAHIFLTFLDRLVEQSGAGRVHIVTHALGVRVVADALRAPANQSEGYSPSPYFGEVVLSAPDIPPQTLRDLTVALNGAARRVTVYASVVDRDLQAALVHGVSVTNLGGALPRPIEGVDVIDASRARTELFITPSDQDRRGASIVGDLREMLASGASPADRRLTPRDDGDGRRYWVLP